MAVGTTQSPTAKTISWPIVAVIIATLVIVFGFVAWRMSAGPTAEVAKVTGDTKWLQEKAGVAQGNINNLTPEDRGRVFKIMGPNAAFNFMQLSKTKPAP